MINISTDCLVCVAAHAGCILYDVPCDAWVELHTLQHCTIIIPICTAFYQSSVLKELR
jgi:hypothetical protein